MILPFCFSTTHLLHNIAAIVLVLALQLSLYLFGDFCVSMNSAAAAQM